VIRHRGATVVLAKKQESRLRAKSGHREMVGMPLAGWLLSVGNIQKML